MTGILVVDGDATTRQHTRELLERAGLRVRAHADAAAALDDAAAAEPDAIVWDVPTPEDAALAPLWARGGRFRSRTTPLVVLSPSADPADVARSLEAGADDCLPKPVAPAVLVAILRARLRSRRTAVALRWKHRDESAGQAPGAPGAPEPAAPHHPAGRLSGVRIGDRVVQIQTEYTTVPEPRIVTVVMMGGRTVNQRATPAPRTATREDLERLVTAQHVESEEALRAKVRARAARGEADNSEARFAQLHDEGLNRFLEGNFAAAVVAWEEALRVNPRSQALTVNLAVARRKRDAAAQADPGERREPSVR